MRAARAIALAGLPSMLLLACGCGGADVAVAAGVGEPTDAGSEEDAAAGGDAAVEELAGEILDPELQELIDQLAEERDPRALERLARALGDHPHPAAVDRLITLLASEREPIRAAAIESIERLGEAAVEPLIHALDSSVPQQRDRVIGCLAAIGDPRAITELIRVLPATAESRSAARALTRFGDTAAKALLEALAGDNGATRVQAVIALELMPESEAIADALVAALEDEWAPVRAQAAAALGAHGKPAATAPLAARLEDPDVQVRVAVAGALGRIGTAEAVEALEQVLADEDPQVRGAAAEALAATKDPALVRLLYRAVADEHHQVRVRARDAFLILVTEALGGTPGREIVARLTEMLDSEDPETRASVAYLLGALRAPRAARAVGRLLRDDDEDVRWAALSALKDLEDPSSVGALIGALDDEDAQIRAGAAELLGALGAARALKPLARLLRDPEPDVRLAAAEALEAIPRRSAPGPLIAALGDEDDRVADAAWRALSAIGAGATGKLAAAFKRRKTGTRVRVRIAELLGRQPKDKAVLALIGGLGDRDDEVAAAARAALAQLACDDLGAEPGPWKSWWQENRRLYSNAPRDRQPCPGTTDDPRE